MAGNYYGPRGNTPLEQTANRAIEQRIIGCLRNENNFGTRFNDYGCLSENHSTSRPGSTPGQLSSRVMLATRDITVRLGRPDSAYRIKYNTATNTHTVTKPTETHRDLPAADIQMAITCITSNQGGGKKRHYKNRTKMRRRKYSYKRH